MTTPHHTLTELHSRLEALRRALPAESSQAALTGSLVASMGRMEPAEAQQQVIRLCMHLNGLYGGNALTSELRRQVWHLQRLAGAWTIRP